MKNKTLNINTYSKVVIEGIVFKRVGYSKLSKMSWEQLVGIIKTKHERKNNG